MTEEDAVRLCKRNPREIAQELHGRGLLLRLPPSLAAASAAADSATAVPAHPLVSSSGSPPPTTVAEVAVVNAGIARMPAAKEHAMRVGAWCIKNSDKLHIARVCYPEDSMFVGVVLEMALGV